jgi:hypothetical protein
MKSANFSFFAAIVVTCALAVSSSMGCGVSGDGLGNATDPSSDKADADVANGGGMNSGAGNAPGQAGDMQPAAGGTAAMGAGGSTMMGGGGKNTAGTGGKPQNSGGMNVAGMNVAGMNAGGMNVAGMNVAGMNVAGMNVAGMNGAGMNIAGMNIAGMNVAGMNVAGMNVAGMNAGGNVGLIHNVSPTPGEIKCGSDTCTEGDICCITNGQAKCQGRNKDCSQGAFRGCDDQQDCRSIANNMVCCGSQLQNSFVAACVLAIQCTPPTEVVICANATQCTDGRLCCARSVSNMTLGICQRSCQ